MLVYALKRLALAIPTLLLAAAIVFALVRLVPGDPAQVMLGDIENPAALARLRAALKLDQPLPVQFAAWGLQVLQGDLGTSIASGQPVAALLGEAFPVTASLTVPAVLLATAIAVPAGLLAAWRRGRRLDGAIVGGATLLLSVPSFWLGLMALLVFGVWLDLFPVVGYVSPRENLAEGLSYLVLPVLSLGLIEAGILTRLVRASAIEVLGQEYITHARAKGLSETVVLARHVLPNAMAPTWTMIGLTLGALLGGAVVTETVFTLPGLGRLMVESIFARDYPVIQGGLLLITAVYVGVNLAVELTLPLFDPAAARG